MIPQSLAWVDFEGLKEHCAELLQRVGLNLNDSLIVSDVCCQAELMGEESHGVRLLPSILKRIESGGDRPNAVVQVLRDFGAIAVWDANSRVGQVSALDAMNAAMQKARGHGLGLVTVRNSGSFTSARYYALHAARAGMIGAAYTSTTRKMMPPHGGKDPVLGNNPVAYAAPSGNKGPFLLDMACTVAAIERIQKAYDADEPIPIGWALDALGNDTTSPAAALESLTLLPFGGYKAFGLAMVHEVLTAVLSGGLLTGFETAGFQPYSAPMRTSFSMLAIDVSKFMPLAEFELRMETLIDIVKSSRPRTEGQSVVSPGERSNREARVRASTGIPVLIGTLDGLEEWANMLGVVPIARSTNPLESR